MHTLARPRCILASLVCFALAGCGQETESSASTSVAATARMVADSPRSQAEEWSGRAGDWELTLTLEGTELNGTVFHRGKVRTSRNECMASGTVSGNINSAGGVNWIAVGQDMEFVVSGTGKDGAIKGVFESTGGSIECNTRVPVTLTRRPAS